MRQRVSVCLCVCLRSCSAMPIFNYKSITRFALPLSVCNGKYIMYKSSCASHMQLHHVQVHVDAIDHFSPTHEVLMIQLNIPFFYMKVGASY